LSAPTPHPRLIVILGPTAGGKSQLAVGLAERIGGEIINADSMQVYRHLNVGTAKPTARQRARAVHHLVDIVEPTESWTVHDWLAAAERAIADVQQRGLHPIVVGGTHLYLRALLEGMFEGPPADEAFRESLADTPSAELHDRLKRIDPDAATRIHPNDHRRIIRALEVHHQTGQTITALQQQWSESGGGYRYDPILVGLDWPREAINRRINARVKAMFQPPEGGESLIEETRRLAEAGLLGQQAREALGTKQALDALAGRLTAEQAMEKTKIETRRFAKQQRTWLKRFRGVHWLSAGNHANDPLVDQAAEIVRAMPATGGGG